MAADGTDRPHVARLLEVLFQTGARGGEVRQNRFGAVRGGAVRRGLRIFQTENQSFGFQDFVCLGRPHLADPAWTKKVREWREQDIKRCISCLWCFESFLANATKDEPLECAVNPHLGRECETSKPLINGAKRMVAIIGAGPAGLSAAEILALRGFQPIVLEKNAFAGGQLQLANKPP